MSPYPYRTQLYGLQYSTYAVIRHQTADYQQVGSEPITSKGMKYAPWDNK